MLSSSFIRTRLLSNDFESKPYSNQFVNKLISNQNCCNISLLNKMTSNLSIDIRPQRAGSFNESDLISTSSNSNNNRIKYQQQQQQQHHQNNRGAVRHSSDPYMQMIGAVGGSSYPPAPSGGRFNHHTNNSIYGNDPSSTYDLSGGGGYDQYDSPHSASIMAPARRRPRRESFGSGRSSPTSSLESASARSGSSSSLASSMMTLTSVDSR